ncbi:MAG: acylphosphatase [Candidatus Micrarchaeota archaeon]
MNARLRLIIHGDVQGVFFRAGAETEAKRLGLVGWVKNLPDGSVETMAEGERNALLRFLDWCSHGPAGASVSAVEKEWLKTQEGFKDFRIIR